MKDPKERNSETILPSPRIVMFYPIDEVPEKKKEIFRKKSKENFLFAECLDVEDFDLFNCVSRNKGFAKEHINRKSLEDLKSQMASEASQVIAKFRLEMEASFESFKEDLKREIMTRHRRQMRKVDKLLRRQQAKNRLS